MAPPTKKLTDEQVAQVETLAQVLTNQQIADYFGIGKRTFDAIRERDPRVDALYKKGKAKAVGAVAQSLLAQARTGNLTAAIFFLKTQAGWRERDHLDDGSTPVPVTIHFTAKDCRADNNDDTTT